MSDRNEFQSLLDELSMYITAQHARLTVLETRVVELESCLIRNSIHDHRMPISEPLPSGVDGMSLGRWSQMHNESSEV